MATLGSVRLFVRGYSALVLLAVAAGCGTSIAQTAKLGPEAQLDCSEPGALALPQNQSFGDGKEAASPLLGSAYAAGAGPGLYVAARDAFRVYLNGALVAASSAARMPLFVPLSLLPGDNAVAVVVAAQSGTPAAAVQIDELDRSYVSDAGWRVSTAPASGYAATGYDDSSWPVASDFGVLGSLPGCDPGAAFPMDSAAHWLGPALGSGSVAVLRKVISIAPVGFGAGATGGNGATPLAVSTWDDLLAAASEADTPAVILLAEGEHDFRTAARDQPACPSTCTNDASKPQYTVLVTGQTCAAALVTRSRTDRILKVGSNKTLVGLGRGASLRGVTVDFGTSHNSVLRNLAMYDVDRDLIEAGDAFTLTGPSELWIDHCTAKWISDGFTDVTTAQNITLSWMRYDGVTTDECDGEHTRASSVTDSTVTYHHCFFDHVEGHAPAVRDALSHVHVFNDLISDNLGYGVGSVCGSQVLLEGNAFQRVATPTTRGTCADGTALGLIDAPAGSNYYGDDVGMHHGGDGLEPHDVVFKPPYAYSVEPAQQAWPKVLLRAGAGGQWALPLALN